MTKTKKPSPTSPFAKLAELKKQLAEEPIEPPSHPKRETAPKQAATDDWQPDERNLLAMAMAGVKPLSPNHAPLAARDTSSATPSVRPPSVSARRRRACAEGGPTLEIVHNAPDYIAAVRPGKDFALEALGRLTTADDTLDLHGLDTLASALRIEDFVRSRHARGLRCLCIIHGRGKNSPDGGVLRNTVVDTLVRAPTCSLIDALKTSPNSLGGAGSLLVALNRK